MQCVLTSGTVLKACPQRMQGLGINTGGELIAKLANSCSSGKTAVRTVCVVVCVCVCVMYPPVLLILIAMFV